MKHFSQIGAAFSTFILIAAIALLGTFVQAGHQSAEPSIAPDYNRQECSGSHCTFIASWMDRDHVGVNIIEAIMTMDVFALEFGIANSTGEVTRYIEAGESFTVPIDASGEIIGHAGRFDDSPPITFQPNGVVHAETLGLEQCGFAEGSIAEGAKGACLFLQFAPNEDILGKWTDQWRAVSSGGSTVTSVSCSTQADGTQANCTSSAAATGNVQLELTRTVNDFEWQNYDSGKLRIIPVIALYKQLDLLVKDANVQNPFPGSLKSTVTISFDPEPTAAPTPTADVPECSDGLDNDNDGVIDCEDFGCFTDKNDPSTCDPNDDSESDTPVIDPGVFQEGE